MTTLSTFITYEVWIGLAATVLILAYKLLNQEIATHGLLSGKGPSKGFSPGRYQLLISTLAVAGIYLGEVCSDRTRLPTLPNEVLALLFGSQLAYVAGKKRSSSRATKKGV